MAQTETDDAEPATKAKAPPLNKEIKELDMTKLIKLFTLAVLWLMETLHLPAEQVFKAMKLSESERAALMPMLQM